MATREAPEFATLLLEAARVVGAEVLNGPPQLLAASSTRRSLARRSRAAQSTGGTATFH